MVSTECILDMHLGNSRLTTPLIMINFHRRIWAWSQSDPCFLYSANGWYTMIYYSNLTLKSQFEKPDI